MECLFKGILAGLMFGVPIGAVGAMTVKRSIDRGFRHCGNFGSVELCLACCGRIYRHIYLVGNTFGRGLRY